MISQKEPALDVIKEKIEPFLTKSKNLNEGFQGITYYKNDSKNSIKSNIEEIKSFFSDTTILNKDLGHLENELKGNKLLLRTKLDELKIYTEKLSSNLQKEVEYSHKHDIFIKSRDWFIEQSHIKRALPLGKKHQFKKSEFTFEDHKRVLEPVHNLLITLS